MWELCNVEKLHCMLYCMCVNFVLWDNCAVFGGQVMCVIVLDVRVLLCVSCVLWLCCGLFEGYIVCGLCCIWIMLDCGWFVFYVEVLCWDIWVDCVV